MKRIQFYSKILLALSFLWLGIVVAREIQERNKRDEEITKRVNAEMAAVNAKYEKHRDDGLLKLYRGKILQHVPQGLLLECNRTLGSTDGHGILDYGPYSEAVGSTSELSGTVLLTGYPSAASIADDKVIGGVCRYEGTFQYATVLGATKTIEKYSWRPNEAARNAHDFRNEPQ